MLEPLRGVQGTGRTPPGQNRVPLQLTATLTRGDKANQTPPHLTCTSLGHGRTPGSPEKTHTDTPHTVAPAGKQ